MGRICARRPDLVPLVTSDTPPDPADLVHLPARTKIAPAPGDSSRLLRQFLDRWTPAAAVWAGELRPPHAIQCQRRDIPQLWVDARISGRQAWRLRWAPLAEAAPLRALHRVLSAPGPDGDRLGRVPGLSRRLERPGFLQRAAAALPCDHREREAMSQLLAVRPVWFAADIPEAEIEAVLHAHYQASRQSHRLLLILAPGGGATGEEVRDRVETDGWRVALRSAGEDPQEEAQILIADIPDEYGLWYRLSPVTFMGETLTGGGCGRSPLEAAALGSALLHGPLRGPHAAAYAQLSAAGGACQVESARDLGRHLGRVLSPEAAADLACRAWEVTTQGAAVTDRVVALLDEMLDRVEAA